MVKNDKFIAPKLKASHKNSHDLNHEILKNSSMQLSPNSPEIRLNLNLIRRSLDVKSPFAPYMIAATPTL